MKSSEYRKQAEAGSEANIHKASFIKRRLFYLNNTFLRPERSRTLLCGVVEGQVQAKETKESCRCEGALVPHVFAARSNLQHREEIAHLHYNKRSAAQVSSERAKALLATTFALEATLSKTWQGIQ